MHYTAAVLLLTLANPQGIFGQSLEMDGLYDYVSNNTGSTSGFKNILKNRNSSGNINPGDSSVIDIDEVYGEELSMRFYDSSEDIWYYCQDHILFAANGITGSILDPMMISLSPLSIGDRGYVPDTYVLSQNYPNPFNPVTSIGFGVPEPADVTVMIYNILGQEVRELYRSHMQPGYQFMKWDGKDMFGTPGPSGMYIVVMQAGEFMDTKKVILLK